jgi:hypothetical protein
MLKKFILSFLEQLEAAAKNTKNEPSIIKPYTSQDNEEITKLLTNFDNATLMTHITTLEKVVVKLTTKVEVQSGVIVRQSEILRDMHGSLEEILHLLETATSAETASKPIATQLSREDSSLQNKKTNLN